MIRMVGDHFYPSMHDLPIIAPATTTNLTLLGGRQMRIGDKRSVNVAIAA